jgi:hypothetical protein
MKRFTRRMCLVLLVALVSLTAVTQPVLGSEGGEGCTRTQGYWKNHPNAWPVSSLTLAGLTYTKAQLLALLNTPTQGNGAVSLMRQLIAAKLNVIATGISDSGMLGAITAANALLSSCGGVKVPGCVLDPSLTSELVGTLDDYNNGILGPGHCAE